MSYRDIIGMVFNGHALILTVVALMTWNLVYVVMAALFLLVGTALWAE